MEESDRLRLYAAIFLGTLSTVFIPLPEEATLLAAGFAARLGQVTVWGAIVAAWLACLLGDSFSYFIGRVLLVRLLRTQLGRKMLPEKWRAWGERLVAANGDRAVVIARFLVGLRGFVYFAVGASRYPFGRFLVVDGLAGLVEVGGLVAAGYAFGELHARAQVAREVDVVVALVLILALFGPAVVRAALRRRRW